jgi:two-component system sensor histidine kinase CiaH
MQNESKPFGVKATNSFKKSFNQSFNQSILKLSFLYGTILVTILCISGVITFNEFSGRVGKRFNTIPPTITIQLQKQIRNEQMKQAQMPTAEDIRADLIASLIFVNGILLLLASIASYWLARLTLKPIQVAYEKQRRFLGDASHELRTPLSILQIELENELHTEKNAATRNTDAREAIESKLEEVQRMSKLVSDLLTLSRLDDGVADKNSSRNRKVETIHMQEFEEKVQSIVTRLEPLATTHAVSLSYKSNIEFAKDKQRRVTIDVDLLSHALTNLIQNAIFYNKKDGQVLVTVSIRGRKIRIVIEDTGIGISEHDLERIFDRFYRADKSRTRSNVKHSGSGLGLSIARSTLAHIGGTLHLTSEIDKGTTAIVEIEM